MPSVRLPVGFPPVGTSDTGLRPPLWAPFQIYSQVSSPSHDVPSTHIGRNGPWTWRPPRRPVKRRPSAHHGAEALCPVRKDH